MSENLRNLTAKELERAMDEAFDVVMARLGKASERAPTDGARPYIMCAERGMSATETARKLGVTRSAVYQMAKKHNIEFRDGRKRAKYDG